MEETFPGNTAGFLLLPFGIPRRPSYLCAANAINLHRWGSKRYPKRYPRDFRAVCDGVEPLIWEHGGARCHKLEKKKPGYAPGLS
jgi:hypothetical protein